jgi:hypothetical protein
LEATGDSYKEKKNEKLQDQGGFKEAFSNSDLVG